MKYIISSILVIIVSVSVASASVDWTIFQIAADPAFNHSNPHTDGTTVVWHANPAGGYNDYDIFAQDIVTGQRTTVCSAAQSQLRPSVSGNIVVWEDRRVSDVFSDIYGYDLSTGQEFAISTDPAGQAARPEIYSNDVVYKYSKGSKGVNVYDLSTSTERQVYSAVNSPLYVQMNGGVAVWQEYMGAGSQNDIIGYDLVNDQVLTICSNPESQFYPHTDGQTVVWHDRRKGNDFDMDIYAYDLATGTETPLDTGAANSHEPSVDGNTVVWVSDGGLYCHDLASGDTHLVAAGVQAQDPQIRGDYVVWSMYNWDTSKFEVWGAKRTAVDEPVRVLFDLYPQSKHDWIGHDRRVLPAAILGTPEFDVSKVDPTTLLLGREGYAGTVAPIRWTIDDVLVADAEDSGWWEYLRGDGIDDLMLKFDGNEVEDVLELDGITSEWVELTITGFLEDGSSIEGADQAFTWNVYWRADAEPLAMTMNMVPEPASLLVVSIGLASIASRRRRR